MFRVRTVRIAGQAPEKARQMAGFRGARRIAAPSRWLRAPVEGRSKHSPGRAGASTGNMSGGSGGRIRTYDQRINSPLRYRCATPE